VIGRCAATTGIAPFSELVEQVMTREPYASARRVFWVVDNGSSHAGQASLELIRQAWPTAELVHLPVLASWLNLERPGFCRGWVSARIGVIPRMLVSSVLRCSDSCQPVPERSRGPGRPAGPPRSGA
jgi:hypothetical protein